MRSNGTNYTIRQDNVEANAWLCVTVDNALRKRMISLVGWRWFERIVIVVIVVNCIMLALYDPMDARCQSTLCAALEKLEVFVFAFFCGEMLAKMTAMGVLGGKGYFSDRWNTFDFLIVVAGIVDLSGTSGGFLTIVRLCRILRPLRAINRVPNIRILVSLLMDTVPMLGNVLILAFLVFSCFGILGVQLFQGKLRNRCYWSDGDGLAANVSKEHNNTRFPDFYLPTTSIDFVCRLNDEDDSATRSCEHIPKKYDFSLCQVHYRLSAQLPDNNTNTSCLDAHRYYRTCKNTGPNPYYGSVSFDNIALAFIFIYQVVTLEGWSDLMYLIQDSYSNYAWVYFVTLISIGSFFLVNLALVVITMQFSETKRREVRLIKQNRNMASSQLSLYTDLCSMWKRICKLFSCFTNYFRSIHYIHQHVFVHQQSSLCDQCRRECTPPSDDVVATQATEQHFFTIPNIEVSQFDHDDSTGNEMTSDGISDKTGFFTMGGSASFPGQYPKSLDLLSCSSYEYSITSEAEHPPPPSIVVGTPNRRYNTDIDVLSPMRKTFNYVNSITTNETDNNELNNNSSGNNKQLLTPTISVHAGTSVTVRGSRSSSIRSRTSLSLKINGESFGTSARLDTTSNNHSRKNSSNVLIPGHAPTKSRATSFCSTSQYSATDSSEYSTSDFGYGSVFDLRHCDKYYVSEIPNKYKQFKLFCKHLSESTKYSDVIMTIIVCNTICMAIEHHNEPLRLSKILETLNLIFIWVFTVEMVIKMFGIGFKTYFNMGFNCFDAFVVILSILELLINDTSSSGNFTVFRSLRLLRIFRLIRPMRHQIAVMLRTTSSVMTFFALLFLFMFTFAILGMHIFGGKFVFKDKYGKDAVSRSNFDSFVWAIVTVFQILTQEDWNLVMYDGIRATNQWASLYFLSLMTIGYYVLFNLLVAILVEGFTTPLEKRRMTRRILSLLKSKAHKKTSSHISRTISLPDMLMNDQSSVVLNETQTSEKSPSYFSRFKARRSTLGVIGTGQLHRYSSTVNNTGDSTTCSDDELPAQTLNCAKEKSSQQNKPVLLSARVTYGDDLGMSEWNAEGGRGPVIMKTIEGDKREGCCGSYFVNFTKYRENWSLYLFPVDSKFRRLMTRLSNSKWFDGIILLFILYSCVLLALENPHKETEPKLRQLIDISMFLLTWVFFGEMMIKIISDGFVSGKRTYLRNAWNILDFGLVLTSIVDVFVTLHYSGKSKAQHREIIKGIRVLRATRALRPLRMIRRAPGLKLVVQTLLYSLKPIGNTVLIATVFFIVFGILGVQQLKGKFYYCFGVPNNLVHNKTDCKIHPDGLWVNYQYNFDNLFEALMALFVVSTKDGWMDIMRRGIDARGVDLEPRTNFAQWRILYFVSFLLIGGFLVLNMIVGVVVENFQKCQEIQDSQSLKARNVIKRWKTAVQEKNIQQWKEYPMWRQKIYRMCTHGAWDIVITITICSNIAIMAVEHYKMSHEFHILLESCNIIFTVLYVFESILLMIALSPQRYVKNKWYCFDLVIVVVSVVGILLENINVFVGSLDPAAIKATRLLRVVRALKLLKMAKGLRFLLDHVAETIPQVTNLALLFSLLFFVYSCLGMQLFGTLECTNRFPCAGLGRHANFKTLGNSMLTLFRIATGDNWSGILRDTLRSSCDNAIQCSSNCCVSRYVAPLFFVSFVLFAQFVLVNIVIAVLMKHLRVSDDNKRKQLRKISKKRGSQKSNDAHARQTSIIWKAFSKWRENIQKKKAEAANYNNEGSPAKKTRIEFVEHITNKLESYHHNHSHHYDNNKTSSSSSKSAHVYVRKATRKKKKCNHEKGTCFRSRKKLLRKSSCPEKLHSMHSEKLRPPSKFNITLHDGMTLIKHRLEQKPSEIEFNRSLSRQATNDDYRYSPRKRSRSPCRLALLDSEGTQAKHQNILLRPQFHGIEGQHNLLSPAIMEITSPYRRMRSPMASFKGSGGGDNTGASYPSRNEEQFYDHLPNIEYDYLPDIECDDLPNIFDSDSDSDFDMLIRTPRAVSVDISPASSFLIIEDDDGDRSLITSPSDVTEISNIDLTDVSEILDTSNPSIGHEEEEIPLRNILDASLDMSSFPIKPLESEKSYLPDTSVNFEHLDMKCSKISDTTSEMSEAQGKLVPVESLKDTQDKRQRETIKPTSSGMSFLSVANVSNLDYPAVRRENLTQADLKLDVTDPTASEKANTSSLLSIPKFSSIAKPFRHPSNTSVENISMPTLNSDIVTSKKT